MKKLILSSLALSIAMVIAAQIAKPKATKKVKPTVELQKFTPPKITSNGDVKSEPPPPPPMMVKPNVGKKGKVPPPPPPPPPPPSPSRKG